MADTPNTAPAASVMPYIWAAVMMFLVGVILIGMILYLRPTYDPLVVIGGVGGLMTTFVGVIATFIKSQETHLTVNSQLTMWKKEFQELKHAEGLIQGTHDEQNRVAEQKRVAALTQQQAPTPVTIAGATAVNGHVPVVPTREIKQ